MKSYNEIAEKVLKRRDQYNTEKKHKMKLMLRVAVAVFCLAGIIYVFDKGIVSEKDDVNVTLAAEIQYNLTKLSELEPTLLLSSNPYDFKDEENYDNIIEMGSIAMVILHEKYLAREIGGLNAYIAGTAIEDIAKVRIVDVTGVDWASAEEFFTAWQSMLAKLPLSLKEIAESEGQASAKIEAIKAYGVFGTYFLEYIRSYDKNTITFHGEEIDVEEFREDIPEKSSLSENEYSIISDYLKEHCEY